MNGCCSHPIWTPIQYTTLPLCRDIRSAFHVNIILTMFRLEKCVSNIPCHFHVKPWYFTLRSPSTWMRSSSSSGFQSVLHVTVTPPSLSPKYGYFVCLAALTGFRLIFLGRERKMSKEKKRRKWELSRNFLLYTGPLKYYAVKALNLGFFLWGMLIFVIPDS